MPSALVLRECNDMKTIDIFYQGEGIREVGHLEADAEDSFGKLKDAIARKHGLTGEILIFLEDKDEPHHDREPLHEHAGHGGLKVHVHSCRDIKVTVTFNGESVHHAFGPGATIARVKHWAAVKKLGM